jgi:RNA polymerase sigma-70 factor (ECF subfamily)
MVRDAVPADPLDDLYRSERDRIVTIARRILGDQMAAQDVANETFLRFAALPAEARAASQARSWLYRVATTRALNELRERVRRERREGLAARLLATERLDRNDPAEQLEALQTQQTVRRVLARLTPAKAQILMLRYAGLSYRELAIALGVSPTSVGTSLARAERAFRKEYERHASH